MAAVIVEYVIGYQGAPLCYVDNARALSICGNSICYYSLCGGKNTHAFWGEGVGMSTIAYHGQTRYVAYAEKGLKPSIYIHDCKDQRYRLITKISDVAELEISALAFSHDARLFATASCEPDFRLILWIIQANSAEKLIEGHLGEGVAQDIRFNPLNRNQLCVSGCGEIYIWTFQSSYHKTSFTCNKLLTGTRVPLCFTWTSHENMIYVGGKDGEIFVYNIRSNVHLEGDDELHKLQRIFKVHSTCDITHICVREEHLLVAMDGGHLLWVQTPSIGLPQEDSTSIELAQFNSTLDTISEIHLALPDIVSIAYRDDGAQILIGSSNGVMMTLHVSTTLLQHMLHGITPMAEVKVEDHKSEPLQSGPDHHKGAPQTVVVDPKAKPQSTLSSQVALVEWQSTHHIGSILAMGTLRDGKYLVTCGKDSTVRIWETEKGKEVYHHQFKFRQNCLATHEPNCTVAIGAENGDVHILKVDSAGHSVIIFHSKVHRCSLDVILFSRTTPMLVVASHTDERVFFLHSETPDWMHLQLLGFALMKDPVLSMAWDIQSKGDEDMYIMISLLRGEIVRIKVPTTRAPGGGLVFETKVIRRISIRTTVPLNSIVVGKYYLEKEGVERRVVWGLGADKKLLLYRLPDSLQGWTGPDAMPHTAQHNLLAHAKPGFAIVFLPEVSILVTGTEDGVLQIRNSVLDPVKPPTKVLEIKMFDGHSGGITCATIGGGRLFIGSATGLVFSCDAADVGIVKMRGSTISRMKDDVNITDPKKPFIGEDHDENMSSMVEDHEKKLQERSLLAAEAYKNEMRKSIVHIRNEFNELRDKNKEAPELEKLNLLELIVDIDLEKSLRNEGEDKVEDAHEKVNADDLKKDSLVEHIKTECWSTMLEPGIQIWPFSKGHEVQNFSLLASCGFDSRLAKVARLLRNVEMHEQFYITQVNLSMKEGNEKALAQRLSTARSSTTHSTTDNIENAIISNRSKVTEDSKSGIRSELNLAPPEIAPRSNQSQSRRGSVVSSTPVETGTQPTSQQLITLVESTTSPTALAIEVDDDDEKKLELPENGPVENFLYTGYQLTTSRRKRIQRVLLHAQLQEIRGGFNKKLMDLKEDKKQRIVKIKEALARIHDLERALQVNERYVPEAKMVERPGTEKIFTVKNDEIHVKKYLNKAERAAAEEQRKLEEEQDLIRARNNWMERALVDMMGGKLEHKVEIIVVEGEIPRPAWMSGNPKKMTKDQLKEIKEFDAKVKAIKEEKEKKIRGQETEMRKLKGDIEDLSNGFDDAIADLFSLRLKEEARISSIEESISRLSLEIEHEEFFDEKNEEDLVKTLDLLKVSKAASVGAVSEFKREVDAFKEQYHLVLDEDRALDKNFKKEFEELGEFLSQLYRLFRKRQAISVKGDKSKPQTGKDTKFDQNVTEKDRLASASTAPTYQLDAIHDMPEDMEVEQWHRFLRYRNRKIDQEEEVRKMHAHLVEMTGYLDELTTVDDINRKQIAGTLRTLTEFREKREKKRRNLELMFHVKAGSVEMELDPLDGDYKDASLMAKTIIEEFNELVLQRANVKVDMLIQIKNFKRGIYEVQWDIKKLKMLTRNLIEKVRHLQLLRSTKVLQNVIKTGEDVSLASESAALQNRLEHNAVLQEKKVTEKETHLHQLMKQARLVTKQNGDLQSQASMVFQEYSFQESLCSSAVAKESKDAALKQRTDGIFKQRRLRELARAQVDYLFALNNEFERVKAHTLPHIPLKSMIKKKSYKRSRKKKKKVNHMYLSVEWV